MGVKVFCDRCDRFIKLISGKRLRNVNDEDLICKSCLDAEKKSNIQLQKFKDVANAGVIKVANEAKIEIGELVKKAQIDCQKFLEQGRTK